MQASFPWLTALILVALLGAVALWAVKPARKAALPFGVSLSALIFFAFLAAAAFDFDRTGPGRSSCPRPTRGFRRSGRASPGASTAWVWS